MIHVLLEIKFRIFGRDITRFRKEWREDMGLPIPQKRIARHSGFGVTLEVWTA